jgi:hypothetical protein
MSTPEKDSRINEIRNELGTDSPLRHLTTCHLLQAPEGYLEQLPARIQQRIHTPNSPSHPFNSSWSPFATVSLYLAFISILFLLYLPFESNLSQKVAEQPVEGTSSFSSEILVDDAELQAMPESELIIAYQNQLLKESQTDSSLREQALEEYMVLHIDEHLLIDYF